MLNKFSGFLVNCVAQDEKNPQCACGENHFKCMNKKQIKKRCFCSTPKYYLGRPTDLVMCTTSNFQSALWTKRPAGDLSHRRTAVGPKFKRPISAPFSPPLPAKKKESQVTLPTVRVTLHLQTLTMLWGINKNIEVENKKLSFILAPFFKGPLSDFSFIDLFWWKAGMTTEDQIWILLLLLPSSIYCVPCPCVPAFVNLYSWLKVCAKSFIKVTRITLNKKTDWSQPAVLLHLKPLLGRAGSRRYVDGLNECLWQKSSLYPDVKLFLRTSVWW